MNALEYLAQARVNIELLLHMGSDNILYIGVRARPWKNDAKRPIMYLGQGLTVNDALNDVSRSVYYERWQALDYRARPWQNNEVEDTDTESPAQLDFLDTPKLLVTPKAIQRTKQSRELPIVPLDPS